MEQELHKLIVWASHGTLRQFYSEVAAKSNGLGYESELVGNTMRVFSVRREGGLLGIGSKKVRQVALEVTKEGDDVTIAEDNLDGEFLGKLLAALTQH